MFYKHCCCLIALFSAGRFIHSLMPKKNVQADSFFLLQIPHNLIYDKIQPKWCIFHLPIYRKIFSYFVYINTLSHLITLRIWFFTLNKENFLYFCFLSSFNATLFFFSPIVLYVSFCAHFMSIIVKNGAVQLTSIERTFLSDSHTQTHSWVSADLVGDAHTSMRILTENIQHFDSFKLSTVFHSILWLQELKCWIFFE